MASRLAVPAPSQAQPLFSGQGVGGYPFGQVSASSLAQGASYNWMTGQTAAALPRDPLAFLAGAFGPGEPGTVFPIDYAQQGERPDPRRFEYPVAFNLPTGMPGSEGFKLAPFAALRSYADLYSVCRACLDVRENEILGIEFDIVPTDDASIAMRSDTDLASDFQKRAREMLAFWQNPDPNGYNSYHEWLRAILEDWLVIDAVALYLHPPKLQGHGVCGSNVASLDALNGATIKPLLDLSGGRPAPPNPAFHQYLYGVPRREMMVAFSPEEQDDADLVVPYRGDQLLYLRYQPRTYSPYGLSLVEQCLLPIAIGVSGQKFSFDFYREGSIPDTYVVDGRPNATPQQSGLLENQLNAIAMDPAYRRKVLVLPFNSKAQQMKPQALTAGLDQIYAEQVCMVIDVSPHEIGLAPSKGGGLGGKGFQEGQENAASRKSLLPALAWLKRQVFDFVIQQVMGQADMCWKWKGFEPVEDEEKKSNSLIARRNAGELTTDDVRLEQGLDPFGTPFTSKPYYFTATGLISLVDGSTIAIAPPPPPPAPIVHVAGTPPPEGGKPGEPGPDGKPAPQAPKAPDADGGAQATPAKPGAKDESPMHEGAAAIDQSEPEKLPETKSVRSDRWKAAAPAGHTSGMIALVPPANVARAVAAAARLALPVGAPTEDEDDLHVTIAFLGDAAALDQDTLVEAFRAFAAGSPPISGYLNGGNHWLGDDRGPGDPWVANVDCPDLPEFRNNVFAVCLPLGAVPVQNHGANMHMTMAYLPPGSPTPTLDLPKTPVTFSTLRLALGDEVHDFPLGGKSKVQDADAFKLEFFTEDGVVHPIRGSDGDSGGGKESAPSGQSADEQFSKKWHDGLGAAQKEALFEYQDGQYRAINQPLRDGKRQAKYPAQVTKTMDGMMEGSKLDRATTVYRGMPLAGSPFASMASKDPASLAGSSFVDKGFASTSLDQNIAHGFADVHQNDAPRVLMHIDLPAGSHAMYLGHAMDTLSDQKEMLVNRNTQYTVTSASREGNTLHLHVKASQ